MIFDYYASLAEQNACPKKVNECALASGFADGCLVWSCKAKNEARKCYMKRASGLKDLKLPDLNLDPDFTQLPDESWLGIEIEFELLSPWYSKDDRPFHVLDNPVRKDRVFGTPFMSAASWKGLLRWACRLQAGLYGHIESHGMKMDGWKDPAWIVHLFGNERAEGEEFSRGALVFYPTWFSKVGFEVINPHKRTTRAGTQPIYYEVVPAGTKGTLRLLYAPLPGEIEDDKVKLEEVIANLIDGITALLETYGISAKRTAGWGSVEVKAANHSNENGSGPIVLSAMTEGWIGSYLGENNKKEYVPPEENFKRLMDEEGRPLEILLDDTGELVSKTQFKKLVGDKPDCTNNEFEGFKRWYKKHGEEYRRSLAPEGAEKREPVRGISIKSLSEFKELAGRLKHAAKGGGR